ncbi:Hydroxyethylthiazole kinase family protein [Hibiscus syriacus]|uniref:Hydroxyethylthiazole kinase family protein n=1 Tax=Hibiscus syriacus TaxID=106335 RepID=A0A6A2XM56_HIBSY|nr:Hydroxyethylthiazole kinase family protein [Hibiscus syriacus]
MQHHHQNPPPYTTTAASAVPKDHSKCNPYLIVATFFISLFFILSLLSTSASQSLTIRRDPALFPNRPVSRTNIPTPPSIAYLISGSAGDSVRILRLLFASYHPRNHYLLHLDLSATQTERDQLVVAVLSVPIFRAAQNVNVIGKANYAYRKGSSTISSTLHGASILLRLSSNWDWFIALNAGDYPIVTQDDLLHILSYLPKNLNFVNHSSYINWKESKRLKPIIVDTGHYLLEKDEYVTSNVSSSKKPSLTNSAEFDAMIQSGDAFAAEFQFDDPVLDRIDRKILKRKPGRVVPGGWCLGVPKNDTCSLWGDADILRPGPGAKRLEKRIVRLLSDTRFRSRQCLDE